jgi:hypothetical protein
MDPLAKLLAGDTTILAGRAEAAALLVIADVRRPEDLLTAQTSGLRLALARRLSAWPSVDLVSMTPKARQRSDDK